MLKNLLLGLTVVLLFTRCSEEVIRTTEAEIGREYYPIKVGNYWIYDVTETKVINNQYDSTKYQVRELVESIFQNAANEQTYRVIRSRRNNADASWGNDTLVSINKSSTNVRRTQNNFITISLVFPVSEGKYWDTNAFNILDADDYAYAAVNQPFTLNNIRYDSTVTVVQGEPDLVTLDDRREVYAYKVGLVYKKFTLYEYAQKAPENFPDPTRVARGLQRVYKLNTFYAAD